MLRLEWRREGGEKVFRPMPLCRVFRLLFLPEPPKKADRVAFIFRGKK